MCALDMLLINATYLLTYLFEGCWYINCVVCDAAEKNCKRNSLRFL